MMLYDLKVPSKGFHLLINVELFDNDDHELLMLIDNDYDINNLPMRLFVEVNCLSRLKIISIDDDDNVKIWDVMLANCCALGHCYHIKNGFHIFYQMVEKLFPIVIIVHWESFLIVSTPLRFHQMVKKLLEVVDLESMCGIMKQAICCECKKQQCQNMISKQANYCTICVDTMMGSKVSLFHHVVI